MSVIIKKNIPLTIAFLIGVLLIFEWFIITDLGTAIGTGVREWGIILNTFAIMVGVVGFYMSSVKSIIKRANDWHYSVWQLILVTVFILVGVPFGYQSSTYQWLYSILYLPQNATMYGVIGFYIVAASYRVLKLRSLTANILLISAVILILANTPLISSFWMGFLNTGAWIMKNITEPVYRGIMIGTSLGTLAVGIRVLIGREIAWLGRKEEG